MVKKALVRFAYFLSNIISVFFSCVFIKSKKYILVGAWMGEKFADNPRFLFQYLNDNKEKENIKQIVWVTRSIRVNEELRGMGYKCYKIGSLPSFFWHCKCGIHIVCNFTTNTSGFKSDIDTRFSALSKKVQLWHGNGIKCVPSSPINESRLYCFFDFLSTPGFWYYNHVYYLCKSDMDVEFFNRKFFVNKEHCIDSSYPRVCKCLHYLNEEENIIDRIKAFKQIILYLPTFRANYDNYLHPLTNTELSEYLLNNDIVWIEKPHSADKASSSIYKNDCTNVIQLDSRFDINVLYPFIDLLITDYSSSMLDALFFKKQILYYTPDYNYYIKNDRGFLIDYDSVCISPRVEKINNLLSQVRTLLAIKQYDEKALGIRRMFWKYDDTSYSKIWKDINDKLF